MQASMSRLPSGLLGEVGKHFSPGLPSLLTSVVFRPPPGFDFIPCFMICLMICPLFDSVMALSEKTYLEPPKGC